MKQLTEIITELEKLEGYRKTIVLGFRTALQVHRDYKAGKISPKEGRERIEKIHAEGKAIPPPAEVRGSIQEIYDKFNAISKETKELENEALQEQIDGYKCRIEKIKYFWERKN